VTGQNEHGNPVIVLDPDEALTVSQNSDGNVVLNITPIEPPEAEEQ
jgi:hypothetical protein